MLPIAFACFLKMPESIRREEGLFPPMVLWNALWCLSDQQLFPWPQAEKHCPKWSPKAPSSNVFFNSRNSEPLEFLSVFHCHQLHVFRLSGPSFVPYYASQVAAVKQNVCPEGNCCSCHKRLFEATGMSVMTLQPSMTLGFFSLKAVFRLQVPGTCAGCSPHSKQPTSNPVPVKFSLCFSKALPPLSLTIFSSAAFLTVVPFKQRRNRHWSNIKKPSQHSRFH